MMEENVITRNEEVDSMTEELVDLIMDQEEKDQMKEDSSMTMMSVPKEGEGDSAIEMQIGRAHV